MVSTDKKIDAKQYAEEQCLERLRDAEDSVAQLRARLADLQKEAEYSAKFLVRRDLELTRVNEQLHELDALKSEFLSIVAHQLRTPTTAIKWAASSLSGGDFGILSESQKEAVSRIFISNERMIALINQLLSAAGIDEGRIHYEFSEVDVAALVSEILEDFRNEIIARKIHVEYRPAASLPAAWADREKIAFVIHNLLDNAIKYNKIDGSIMIHIAEDNACIRVEMHDTGIGIPSAQQYKIFSRFFRAKNAIAKEPSGSGIGLYTAKSVIERHGGTIGFKSVEGEGGMFWFTLPRLSASSQSDN